MTFKITNTIGVESFDASPGADILSSALRKGCSVRYSCRQGVCGSCSATVVKGTYSIKSPEAQAHHVDGAPERVLLCETYALSDLEIAYEPYNGAVSSFAAQIGGLVFANSTVAIVTLDIVSATSLSFEAGQFVAIRWMEGDLKYFSIASVDETGRQIELHIRLQPGGAFTQWLFQRAKIGDFLGLEGPHGDFVWKSSPGRPVLLLATGTGFAPIHALIENHALWNHSAPVYLYWGAREAVDFYKEAVVAEWSGKGLSIRYVPVLSREAQGWAGPVGRLPSVIQQSHEDLSGFDVYACGSPEMIDGARQVFCNSLGLDPARFYADPFTVRPMSAAPAPEVIHLSVEFPDGVSGRLPSSTGVSMLQSLMNANLRLDHVCGGGAVCASCRVQVARTEQGPIEEYEQDLLDCLKERRCGERLACQLKVTEILDEAIIRLPGSPAQMSRVFGGAHD
ncbi:2Fe-2S iron-sulfur cluster-binding protein [Pseudomonas monteilii]|uniref:2Fe-2S iron-sulfur cluster-binding protein n=1 Tax=Pseudomonas monteilii TaxID=76759 RepID=UPI00383A80BA